MTAWKEWASLTDDQKAQVRKEHPNINHQDYLYLESGRDGDTQWDYLSVKETKD